MNFQNIDNIIKTVAGVESLPDDNTDKMSLWESWYKGNVADVHSYDVYNGTGKVNLSRNSMNMAKKVCEDWANLLMNEKTDIVLNGSEEDNAILQKVLADCRFWRKANAGVEKTFALGIGAWVVSVDDITTVYDESGNGTTGRDGKVNISFVQGQKVRPITIEDGEITECAFVNINTRTAFLSIHLKSDSGYIIHNVVAEKKGEGYIVDFNDPVKYYKFETGTVFPWYTILKPNVANNLDIDSPYGVSIFANSIDTLKELDVIFDSLQNEIAIGRMRIFVRGENTTMDKDGNCHDVFDSRDVVIYQLPEAPDGKPSLEVVSSPLRVVEHTTALHTLLNILSYQCGFGTEHYRFDKGSVATATQIVSENSEMFRNVKKHEILIEEALIDLTKIVVYAVNNFTEDEIDENLGIEVKFDDSIIEDKRGEMKEDLQLVNDGVMKKSEYRVKWFAETEERAQEVIDEINEEARANANFGVFGA